MGRLERKIERALTLAFIKALVWVLLTPFKFIGWLFTQKKSKTINSSGYVVLTDTGELEHRHIAMKILGRKLNRDEIVHHINGVKIDNAISNLCLMNNEKHEHFHSWLRWKKEKSGKYPTIKNQRQVLKKEYGGLLLDSVDRKLENETPKSSSIQTSLLEELKTVRGMLATEHNVPAYMIFNNKTLEEMATKMPITEKDMLRIKGVGRVKVQRYGSFFLHEIREYRKSS